MDALSVAGAFGTIVQLICNYRAEKGAAAALDHQQFVEWLNYHHHEEIKNLICSTAAVRAEVDALLRADHTLIMAKLDAINTTLASLTSRVPEFRALAVTMVPGAEFSEQAISILRQLVKSDSKWFIVIKWMGPGGIALQLERTGHVEFSEDRFLEDDLNHLVANGLLSLSYSSDGKNDIYGITRNAARLVEAIDGKPEAVR
jgi:hypothetical protein